MAKRHPAAGEAAPIARTVALPGALPGANIGARCVVPNAVIEEDCDIPAGTVIDADDDRRRFHVAPGGTVPVTPDMLTRRGSSAPAPEPSPLRAARPQACCA